MSDPQLSVKSIFGRALELDSWDERNRYLNEACGHDASLRGEVEQLIDAVGRAGDFLGGEALPAAGEGAAAIGTQIGPYKLLELIGEGGMGLVYKAEQQQPVKRHVALKIIKPGMDSRQVIARFEAERQALALMDHPNIARVLDGGAVGQKDEGGRALGKDEGGRMKDEECGSSFIPHPSSFARPYFVMELVSGPPITQFCDERGLPAAARLELFAQVCHAVQHAHQKGVIHRDIKPSNVLVAMSDGRPAPKVIDFGVAKAIEQKLTERTLFTQHGMLLGTLEYMSPEQADLSPAGVDTRSDIYSLGVLLYELLTGTTPFDKERLKSAGFDEIRRIIREEEPETVSKRLARTRRVGFAHQTSPAEAVFVDRGGHSPPYQPSAPRLSELDWIVTKCLEKDRNRRYETASALALDVERCLANEPVLAVPPSAGYRLRKFARRNRGALAIAAGLLLAVTVVAACIGWTVRDHAARRAEQAQAEVARRQAVAGQVRDSIHAARALIAEDKLAAARQKLSLAVTQLGKDRELLGDLATEVDAYAADLDRLQKFLELLDLAQQTATTPLEPRTNSETLPSYADSSGRQIAAAASLRLEALQLYAVLERDDFGSAWESGRLDKPQVEQLRQLAYETLISLANGIYRQQQDDRSGEKLPSRAAAQQALAYLAKAAAARQPTHVLYALRANCNETLGDPAAAAADRQRAHQTPPTIAIDHVAQGQRAQLDRQMAEAVRAYEAALRLEPTHYWSLMLLGTCLCDLGQGQDLNEAARIFTGCILSRPGHAYAYRCRGVAYGRLRRFAEALSDSTRAIELDPTLAMAWYDRGLAYEKLGKPVEALADYSQAIELNAQEARVWSNRGEVYRKLGRLDEAVADYSQAIKLAPDYALAWTNRGVTYAQMGQRDAANADFAKGIELNPKSAPVWYGRGYASLKLRQTAQALTDLSKAIELDPKLADAWDSRGLAHSDVALPGKALADFQSAIELEPRNAMYWYHRGNTYVMLRQYERAVADYTKAIELDGKYVSALNNRGAAYLKLGQPDKAVADCSQAVALAPQKRGHWQTLGTAHYRAGDWQAAVAAYRKSVELSQGGDSLDWHFLAMAHWKLGNRDEARQAFSRAEQWLEQHQSDLKQNVFFADELRKVQAEAQQVLEMNTN